MPLLRWFTQHIAGWQVLVPVILLFVFAAASAERRQRPDWIPRLFFAAWALAVVGSYVLAGVGSFTHRDPALWAAMTGTAVVITLIPLALIQLGAHYARRVAVAGDRWLVGGAVALCGLPLTNVASAAIADLVIPYLRRAR